MLTRNAKGSTGWVVVLGLLAAVVLFGWPSGAAAQSSSDNPAGYVVLPKIVVHVTGGAQPVLPGQVATDTLIQMTNTNATNPINVHCWWINANSHCGTSDGLICDTNADCPLGTNCLPFWSNTNFSLTLTPGQPIGFTASLGLTPNLPCESGFPGPGCPAGHCAPTSTGTSCFKDSDCMTAGDTCTAVSRGAASGVPENPFRGELKCVEVDTNNNPIVANDLKIEATVIRTTVQAPPAPPVVGVATTAASYNAIGFQALSQTAPPHTFAQPLCLGSLPPGTPGGVACNTSYEPCPGVLILDHFFEGATPEFGGVVNTDLTLVPCSEDIPGTVPGSSNFQVTVQMLIYNEFEQRFSSSARVQCYRATSLSDIDTLPGPTGDSFSIFAAGVEGTLTGQTRMRGVTGANGALGYGILGVACENFRETPGGPILATDAFNIDHDLFNANGDAVYIEP